MTRAHKPTVHTHDDTIDGPQLGDVIGDKYRIERLIGRGGMGLVFQAAHVITGKRFAIKWLLPDHNGERHAVDRFIREAQVAGHVDHPNIVEVYDVGKAGESFYMVMELLTGESLEARFLRAGAMPVRDVVRIILPCARGVARAHAAGIVHRDLKPANIFLRRSSETGAETPKVLDFGISKMADAIAPNSAITKTGMLIGTPYYMSPEQVHAKEVDARTDVYALGVILYQLVGGKLPFDAPTYSSLLVKILTEVPEPLESIARGVPDAFARVVRRAMAREPAARFPDMDALITALERVESGARSGRPTSNRFDDGSQRPASRSSGRVSNARRRRIRALLSAAIVLLALGCALAVWYLQRSGSAPEPAPSPSMRDVAAPSPQRPRSSGARDTRSDAPSSLPRGVDVPPGENPALKPMNSRPSAPPAPAARAAEVRAAPNNAPQPSAGAAARAPEMRAAPNDAPQPAAEAAAKAPEVRAAANNAPLPAAEPAAKPAEVRATPNNAPQSSAEVARPAGDKVAQPTVPAHPASELSRAAAPDEAPAAKAKPQADAAPAPPAPPSVKPAVPGAKNEKSPPATPSAGAPAQAAPARDPAHSEMPAKPPPVSAAPTPAPEPMPGPEAAPDPPAPVEEPAPEKPTKSSGRLGVELSKDDF